MLARTWQRLSGIFRFRRTTRAIIPDLATIPVDVPIRIEGPLQYVEGRWLLRIPLVVGGKELAVYTRGISEIKGEVLEIKIPEKLVQNLGLKEGQHLWIHNEDGRFAFEWEPDSEPAVSR